MKLFNWSRKCAEETITFQAQIEHSCKHKVRRAFACPNVTPWRVLQAERVHRCLMHLLMLRWSQDTCLQTAHSAPVHAHPPPRYIKESHSVFTVVKQIDICATDSFNVETLTNFKTMLPFYWETWGFYFENPNMLFLIWFCFGLQAWGRALN